MMFIKSMTYYVLIRIKGVYHYTEMLIVHHSYYHGYRKKEQPHSSIPRDSRISRLCRGVQLYPHGRSRLTTIPLHESKGCHAFQLSLIWPECPTKGLTKVRLGSRSMSPTFPIDATPLLVSRINRSQLVTWLVDPIHDMWSVRVVTRTYVSQYTVLTTPRAMSSEIPHS
jgi:hypothetical protein